MGQHGLSLAKISFKALAVVSELMPLLLTSLQVRYISNYIDVNISLASTNSSLISLLVTQGFQVNKTVEVDIMTKKFQLTFHDFPSTLKPSLHFSTKVSDLLLFC